MRFVMDVKSGEEKVEAPVYSHMTYDITEERITVERPDILIVEGLNVLQTTRPPKDGKAIPFVSDFFDFSIYVDADTDHIASWFVDRFLALRRGAFANPHSFFNVSVVARTPEKATVEGNRYMQKFLELSPWRPKDLKVIAGKVDYPSWAWYERVMIQLIMKYTNGPTDRTAVIDYTDWNDVVAYGRHLATLA